MSRGIKILIIILSVLVVGGGGVVTTALIMNSNSEETSKEDSQEKETENTEEVVEKEDTPEGDEEWIDSLEYEILSKRGEFVYFDAYYVKAKGDSQKINKINDILDDVCDRFWIYAGSKYNLETSAEITYNKDGIFCAYLSFNGFNEPEIEAVSWVKPIIIDINGAKKLTLAEALGITDRDITNYLKSHGYAWNAAEELTDEVEIEEKLQSGQGCWDGYITSNNSFVVFIMNGFHGVEGIEIPFSDVGSQGVIKTK